MDISDKRRFRAVYDDAFPSVYAYLLRRVGHPDVAEDLVQETFMAAVGEIEQRGAGHVTTPWLIGVARHKLADHWRRAEREERRVERWRAERAGPAESSEAGAKVFDALADLPTAQRAAMVLHYLDDLPVAQVAELLGKTVPATDSLLARARHSFRAAYGEEHVDA